MEDSCGPRMRTRSSSDTKLDFLKIPNLPHLVVTKILEGLDFEDLLQCSLVNKFWNYEGRRLLREKHECVLVFNLDKSPLAILKYVEMTLTAGLPVPYASLSIKKEYPNRVFMTLWNPRKLELTANAIKDFILQVGPFKVVHLDCRCHGESSLELWLIRNVLREVLKTVQVLKIKNFDRSQFLFVLEQYPELKRLEVDERGQIKSPDRPTLKNIINYSPKLETVGCLSSGLLYLFDGLPPTRKLELVKEFTCANMDMYRMDAEEFPKLKPKLKKLIIPRTPKYRRNDPGVSISLSLLLSSEASLIELHATLEILKVVRHENPLASFLNVRYLTVDLPIRHMGFDRSHRVIALFPNLERLEIQREPPQPRNYIQPLRRRLMRN